jgi:hypothetical protein
MINQAIGLVWVGPVARNMVKAHREIDTVLEIYPAVSLSSKSSHQINTLLNF